MVILFFKIFETGHLSAIISRRSFCSSLMLPPKPMVLEMVVCKASFISWAKFKEILISGISQPLRSIYMRNVESVQPANDARNVENGSGPRLFPPTPSGSSMSNSPCCQEMVHKYFCVPIFPSTLFSRRFAMVIKRL